MSDGFPNNQSSISWSHTKSIQPWGKPWSVLVCWLSLLPVLRPYVVLCQHGQGVTGHFSSQLHSHYTWKLIKKKHDSTHFDTIFWLTMHHFQNRCLNDHNCQHHGMIMSYLRSVDCCTLWSSQILPLPTTSYNYPSHQLSPFQTQVSTAQTNS